MSANKNKKVLSVFSLVMINVIAVDSIRGLPMAASYGTALLFLYALGTLLYFIPTALITAELSTAFPELGGLYAWVKRAFNERVGFLVVYLQWIYNIVWYPTILTLIAGTCAYLVDPSLIENKGFMITTVLAVFWLCTLLNCFGMKLSSWVSTTGSLIGTLLPMSVMIALAVRMLMNGEAAQIELTTQALVPSFDSAGQLVFCTGILFSLLGLEMSSVHATEVKNPSKDYPKALLISAIIIASSLAMASLAIAIVVPKAELDLVAGIIQAFQAFFENCGMGMLTPVAAMCIVIGGICAVATWIIGPTKGLFAAASDGLLPKALSKSNRFGVPYVVLMVQGGICTLLTLVYLLLPTVKGAYWFLSAMAAQLAFLMYAILFASAIRLRYTEALAPRPFKIPFGNTGMWIVAGMGFIVSIGVIVLGFIPPSGIDVGNTFTYEALLLGGDLLLIAPVLWLKKDKVLNLQESMV